MSEFVKCGILEIAPSQRSLRLEINDPDNAFTERYYISIVDVEAVLAKRKQTATIIKPKENKP